LNINIIELWLAFVFINAGLITVILGVIARAVVANANTNRKILEHLEMQNVDDEKYKSA